MFLVSKTAVIGKVPVLPKLLTTAQDTETTRKALGKPDAYPPGVQIGTITEYLNGYKIQYIKNTSAVIVTKKKSDYSL